MIQSISIPTARVPRGQLSIRSAVRQLSHAAAAGLRCYVVTFHDRSEARTVRIVSAVDQLGAETYLRQATGPIVGPIVVDSIIELAP